ncbi:MAG: hypothetical protein B7X04_02905 [Parcubacteria group bacterium 21-54-25]|nr:MAG: hypothetical protein B7X04_02905 [Parcubacteria group bacterium 21-54-25]HQU07909.1 DUF389 domain-containing protein [Candidatus Paceibacterota bacterium]
MSILSRFQTIEDSDKQRAVHTLVERATPDFDFFFMITLSVFMASFGLLLGSETIVIGSMLIAPLLYPVLGVALGLSMSDPPLLRQSLWTVVKALLIALSASALAALFFIATHSGRSIPLTPTIIAQTAPSLFWLLVGIVAGIAVTYALVRPKLSEALPGVAISVALIPPLAAAGIGIISLNLSVALGSLATFFVNVLGIVAAGMMTFSLMDVYRLRTTAERTLAHEAVRVAQETEKAKAVEEDVKENTGAQNSA